MKYYKAEEVEPEIQINEEIKLTQLNWILQKVAWVSLFVIIALVVAGIFGDGEISLKSVSKQHFNVQYDQFYRYQAEKMIRISSKTQTIKTVSVTQSLMNYFKVNQIVPQPTRSYIEGDSRVFEFYSDKNFTVAFYLVPMESGRVSGSLKINNEVFPIQHFIYP